MSYKKCSNKLFLSEYNVLHIYSIKCLSNVFALVWVVGSCRFIHHHLFSIRFVHAPVLGSTKFSVIYSLMFKTLQLQRFIKCLIITRYDLKFIGICHQLIVAEWLVLLATNLKVSGWVSLWHLAFFKVSLVENRSLKVVRN